MALQIDSLISYLQSDKQSGSTELAVNCLIRLRDLLENTANPTGDELNKACNDLKAVRPSMVALANALQRWQQSWPENDSVDALTQGLNRVIQQLEQAKMQIAQHAMHLFKHNTTVMTHSHSSQVLTLFRYLVDQNVSFNVFIPISSPGNEGLLVAQQLNEWQVPTTIITDAEMGLFMPKVDINISGCDTWLADHYFVNKSGTLLQALAAQHFGKSFWVLADSFKNSNQTHRQVTLESMPADEMTTMRGDFIDTQNIYFETIPTRLIKGRIDEHGIQTLKS